MKKTKYKQIERDLTDLARQELTSERFAHVLRVKKEALRLYLTVWRYKGRKRNAKARRKDLIKLVLSALVHDLTKEKPIEFHRELLGAYLRKLHAGVKFKGLNSEKLIAFIDASAPVLHSFTAALYAQQRLNFWRKGVFNVVRFHTIGSNKESGLSLLFFCADFLGSNWADEHPLDRTTGLARQMAAVGDLWGLAGIKMANNMQAWIGRRKSIPPRTTKLYNAYLKKSRAEFGR